MEKLGIAKEDLLQELKTEYLELKGLSKTASQDPKIQEKMDAVKARIDEFEDAKS